MNHSRQPNSQDSQKGSLLGPRKLGTSPEQLLWNDGWDGYPAARQRLVQSLQKSAAASPQATAVVLGGDMHENWVGHVKADYDRPDSETLIGASLAWLGPRRTSPLSILDLGTGTGCILLTLLAELPAATGVGLDLSGLRRRG